MLKVAAGLLEYPWNHDYIHVKGDIQPDYWLIRILQNSLTLRRFLARTPFGVNTTAFRS